MACDSAAVNGVFVLPFNDVGALVTMIVICCHASAVESFPGSDEWSPMASEPIQSKMTCLYIHLFEFDAAKRVARQCYHHYQPRRPLPASPCVTVEFSPRGWWVQAQDRGSGSRHAAEGPGESPNPALF
ncbi:hypothetical protein E2C01_009022 [Portunus trituberculatus]|uniref:Uncharacterized protein n=1 Tax=Portunus trituberculatus TaxID=210409 RepID=A0A5B7D2B6_PORTR|nr:hypothetical protein [Portunus trituberculatus]